MPELRRMKTRLQMKQAEQIEFQRRNMRDAKQGPLLSFAEIEENYEKVKRINEKNFTAPAIIEKAKAIDETTYKISAFTKDAKIWMPNRVKFGKQVKRALEL